jgi:2,4-dienoyl-CoA reductase (NADPH2)
VFAREWGIDFANHPRGGVTGVQPQVASSGRSVTLLQRKTDPVGKTLGRTTGWTHRATLARRGVRMVNGVEYLKVDDAGLHTRVQRRAAAARGGHRDRLRRPDCRCARCTTNCRRRV